VEPSAPARGPFPSTDPTLRLGPTPDDPNEPRAGRGQPPVVFRLARRAPGAPDPVGGIDKMRCRRGSQFLRWQWRQVALPTGHPGGHGADVFDRFPGFGPRPTPSTSSVGKTGIGSRSRTRPPSSEHAFSNWLMNPKNLSPQPKPERTRRSGLLRRYAPPLCGPTCARRISASSVTTTPVPGRNHTCVSGLGGPTIAVVPRWRNWPTRFAPERSAISIETIRGPKDEKEN
jgi:hypothetical protein